jgi:hypothetical protein
LIRIAGTGLSGSVSGITPPITQYQVGYLKSSPKPADADTCFGYQYPPYYTSTGNIETGLIAYLDPYGNTPLTGFQSFVDLYGEAWGIDRNTGEIGYGSGFFC